VDEDVSQQRRVSILSGIGGHLFRAFVAKPLRHIDAEEAVHTKSFILREKACGVLYGTNRGLGRHSTGDHMRAHYVLITALTWKSSSHG
jgi:hypothetical protein